MIGEIWLVAMREIKEKLRSRSFLLFNAFMLLLVVSGLLLGFFIGSPATQEYAVGLTGQRSAALEEVIREQARASGVEVTLERLPDETAAERAVREGEVDATVVGGARILSEGSPQPGLETLLQSSARSLTIAQTLQGAGASPEQTRAALNPEPLQVDNVGAQSEEESGAGQLIRLGVLLLYLSVFTYGLWIANGIVEEKSSRVVEVVLSAIKPSQLLAGKIIGIGLLGLGQLVLLATVALGASVIANIDLPPATLEVIGAVLLWFVLGYAFYGCMFAVAGSLVSKQEDVQYTQIPIMALILASLFIAVYQLGNLDSLLVRVLSFFPPFTPTLMLVRMGAGEVPAWEVALAVGVMVVATIALVALAVRIYAGSVLRFGARVPLREAWRSPGSGTKSPGRR